MYGEKLSEISLPMQTVDDVIRYKWDELPT